MTDRDKNSVTGMLALLNTNGTTVVQLLADPSTHDLKTAVALSGTDHGPTDAKRNPNQVTTLMVESSDGSRTMVALYADASSNLLLKPVK